MKIVLHYHLQTHLNTAAPSLPGIRQCDTVSMEIS